MPGCPKDGCGNDELDTEATNDALATDPENDYFCPWCGGLWDEEGLAQAQSD